MTRKQSKPLLSSRLGPTSSASARENSYNSTTQTPRHLPKSDPDAIPTIRLISATPSAAGDSSMASTSFERSWNDIPVAVPSIPTPLLPSNSSGPKKRLVPKKSKLSILSGGSSRGASKEQHPESGSAPRSKDLSDVIRRVGGTSSSRGFEIHVDSTLDPDLGDIVMVKKKKSRAALDGMRWGNNTPGALEEVTNVPRIAVPPPSKAEAKIMPVKEKNDKDTGSGRWWALGRGRKDSKDKTKEMTSTESNTASGISLPPSSNDNRGRFNSLDSGLLLETRTGTAVRARVASAQMVHIPPSPIMGSFPLDSPPFSAPLPSEARPLPSRQELPRPAVRSVTPTPTMSYANANTLESLPPRSATPTPTMNGLLAPPCHIATIPIAEAQKQAQVQSQLAPDAMNAGNSGSIAIRAMRSMRSMARLGGWATSSKDVEQVEEKPAKKKEKKERKEKKEKTKERSTTRGEREKKSSLTPSALLRLSSSSFEAGALTTSPAPLRAREDQTLGKKKKSILGLGLGRPSTMRLPSVGRDRSGSTASSALSTNGLTGHPPLYAATNRLSADSIPSNGILRSRSGSGASSLRPTSTCSGISRASSTSTTSGGASSVRWDEACLQTVKEKRRKERQERRESREQERKEGIAGTERESRHSAEGRRRTSLMDIFPEARTSTGSSIGGASSVLTDMESRISVYSTESARLSGRKTPLLTLEEATNDGHGGPDTISISTTETPIKARVRPRPVSEQMLGKSRPAGMYESQGEVLSILSAATNDLAQLINHLDLEATPGSTPNMTPMQGDGSSPQESPTRYLLKNISPLSRRKQGVNTLRESANSSIASLRTVYAKKKAMSPPEAKRMISQQIAPWPAPNTQLSPLKINPSTDAVASAKPELHKKTKRLSHKLSMTPSPAPDSSPHFQPLRPATSRKALNISPTPASHVIEDLGLPVERILSMVTFGSAASSRNNSIDLNNGQPVFSKPTGHRRQQSSLSNAMHISLPPSRKASKEPTPTSPTFDSETKRVLGLAGTMGESSVPLPEDINPEDPDSDIPDELQSILASDDTIPVARGSQTARLLSPGLPPFAPLPSPSPPMQYFSLPSIVLPDLDLDVIRSPGLISPISDSDDNTKKSFDFTGEIRKLNESGVSHRRSFAEQLENAFKTPAKIDLRYGFEVEGEESFFRVINGGGNIEDVPPVPMLDPSFCLGLHTESADDKLLNVSGHTSMDTSEDSDVPILETRGRRPSSTHGELNKGFKFGGKSPAPSSISSPDQMDIDEPQIMKPLTLSDIIPPAEHCRSFSLADEDNSVLQSILAKAEGIPTKDVSTKDIAPSPRQPRQRVNSDSSIHQRRSMLISRDSFFGGPSTRTSVASFTGFESFEEVRRGFEFHDYRPNFYPPPASTNNSRRATHARQESTFSIASISSFGRVLDNGIADPFEYGLPSLQERPSSEELSLCLTGSVDDTFSFMHNIPRRQRVESDASSFYFRAPAPSYNTGHRRRESNMSVTSMAAPPISLYNRSFGTSRNVSHIRGDSSSSFSSLAHNYAVHGANGGRAAWARHRQETSVDSVASDFSAMRLGRPGIGDKMFDTATAGAPLTSILASPSGSHNSNESKRESGSYYSDDSGKHGSSSFYDSIMDGETHSRPISLAEDSLFEKTGYRSASPSDESVFGYDKPNTTGIQRRLLAGPTRYRPISVMSFESTHSPEKESDTIITMLGGGHVRRLSVGSNINASPCVGKRKHSQLRNDFSDEFYGIIACGSPKKARIIEKPSIASASSFKFGEDRMIKATKGLFARQSLEDTCLMGDGEDSTSSFNVGPAFTKPAPTARSRSSTCTTSSSGCDTPPLSSYDSSSQSGGSVSSIDLAHINSLLANATHPVTAAARARARTRGQGHRRRYSQAHLSRSSVYETIEEENPIVLATADSPLHKNSPTIRQAVYIVNPESPEYNIWDDDSGIDALRKYYSLRDEAQDTVMQSQRIWIDTPFSVYALQSFNAPKQPAEMQALLEHSIKNYGPLPRDLIHRVRSRTSSRVSPYPSRTFKVSISPEQARSNLKQEQDIPAAKVQPAALRTRGFNPNVEQSPQVLKGKPWDSPETCKDAAPCRENAFGLAPHARPRVGSGARRVALGWSKRSNGPKSSTGQKENVGIGQGAMIMTPGEGLRINRPRPKGRPTPASSRPIRVRA